MEIETKQSYDEQPNPPTNGETVKLQSTAATNTAWACFAYEVGYGDTATETSVVDKIESVEATIAGKANASHTHTQADISGLATVATTGSYHSLSGTPDLAEVATSGDYNDLTNKPSAYTHPATHPASMITGLADVATSGSYNDLTDKPAAPTIPDSLPADGGNADTVDGMHASEFAIANHTHAQYANASHTHAQGDIAGLTDALDGKASVSHTHNYAPSTHTHTLDSISETTTKKILTASERTKLSGIESGANKYTHPTSHAASMITGLADVATSGSYDDLTDKPTSMQPTAHTHTQSDVTGLASALSGKANEEHTHNQSDITGLSDALAGKAASNHTHGVATTTANGMMSATDKAKLDGVATGANKTIVDSALSTTSTNPVQNKVINTALSGKANSSHAHTLDNVSETTTKKIMTAAERTKLSGIAEGANKYTHPSSHAASMITGLATVATSGKYSDLSGKPTSMTPTAHTHAQSEITGLTSALSGKANQTHTHAQSDVTGLSDALAGKAAVNHTHQIYYSTQSVSSYKQIFLATNGNDNNTGFSQSTPMKTIKCALKKYADTYKFLDIRLADGTYTEDVGTIAIDQCNLSIRSISEDKGKVTLNMQTTMELSVCEMRMYNMTVNVPITGVRAISVNAGVFYAYAVRFNVPSNSNSSCINVYNGSSAFLMNCILNSGTGSSTGACIYGNQAMMIKAINCTSERTVATAFYAHNGSEIIYSDTITATTKTKETYYGKCTVRAAEPNTVLWTGVLYMNANHTITPTKKLSDCQNGWVLLWSDYDEASSAAQDADFVTTIIPKKKPNGGTWDGKTFHCDVPRYYGSNTNDVDTERRIIKTLYIYNNKIVGHVVNDKDERTDVVLRAVYEI